jgi:hypothetical protein
MTVELRNAVAGLIDPTRVQLFRDGEKTGTWQDIRSLWDCLETAGGKGGGLGGRTKFASLPVISTSTVALVMAIKTATTEAAVELVGRTRGSVPENLRCIAATLEDAEQVGWWTERVVQWTQEARSRLQMEPQRLRSVRGVSCPACGARTVHTRQDGELIRQPALGVSWMAPEDDGVYREDHAWRVQAVECRGCSRAWPRGGGISELVDQLVQYNLSLETMCDGV